MTWHDRGIEVHRCCFSWRLIWWKCKLKLQWWQWLGRGCQRNRKKVVERDRLKCRSQGLKRCGSPVGGIIVLWLRSRRDWLECSAESQGTVCCVQWTLFAPVWATISHPCGKLHEWMITSWTFGFDALEVIFLQIWIQKPSTGAGGEIRSHFTPGRDNEVCELPKYVHSWEDFPWDGKLGRIKPLKFLLSFEKMFGFSCRYSRSWALPVLKFWTSSWKPMSVLSHIIRPVGERV